MIMIVLIVQGHFCNWVCFILFFISLLYFVLEILYSMNFWILFRWVTLSLFVSLLLINFYTLKNFLRFWNFHGIFCYIFIMTLTLSFQLSQGIFLYKKISYLYLDLFIFEKSVQFSNSLLIYGIWITLWGIWFLAHLFIFCFLDFLQLFKFVSF